jgi:hypothetical protein
MGDWLKRARKALSTLAYVVTTAVVILFLKAQVRLWLIVGLAVCVVAYASAPYVRKFIARSLAFPRLEAEVIELRAELDQLRAEIVPLQAKNESLDSRVAQLEIEASQRYEDGIDEGKMQWIGAQQSQLAGEPPRLIGISDVRGELRLIGEYGEHQQPIPEATRYEVQIELTGEKRGVVQVIQVVEVNRQVHLACVERTVEEFWARIEDDAVTSVTPPAGIILAPALYPPPRALEHRSGRSPANE